MSARRRTRGASVGLGGSRGPRGRSARLASSGSRPAPSVGLPTWRAQVPASTRRLEQGARGRPVLRLRARGPLDPEAGGGGTARARRSSAQGMADVPEVRIPSPRGGCDASPRPGGSSRPSWMETALTVIEAARRSAVREPTRRADAREAVLELQSGSVPVATLDVDEVGEPLRSGPLPLTVCSGTSWAVGTELVVSVAGLPSRWASQPGSARFEAITDGQRRVQAHSQHLVAFGRDNTGPSLTSPAKTARLAKDRASRDRGGS
jgi:hypothetical protein